MRRTLVRRLALVAVVVTAAAGLAVGEVSTARPSDAAVPCGVLFDDFAYQSTADSALTQRGWHVRTNAGGPGVPGATWPAANVSFPTVDGRRVAQLQATTDGTAAGTTHAEFSLRDRRFFEGTYLARIKFADAPVSGPDGDIVNQTFYTISPLRFPFDPIYSELDFSEYLPNGGWGTTGPTNFQTTWYTYRADPWEADRQFSQQSRSMAGWHEVMATVGNGQVTYYLDGQVVATHGGKFYPRQNMSIDFNQWFIDLSGHVGGGTSVWQQSIDYVFHAKKQILTPAQVTARINAYRSAGTLHADNVTGDNGCSPDTTPPGNPPGGGGNQLISNWHNKCIDVPNRNFTDGQRLVVWNCTGGTNQQWEFVNGTVRTRNNMCMDVAWGSRDNGAAIQIATCSGNPAQQFVLNAASDLVNPQSNRCVDIKDRNSTDGAVLQLWDCSGGANQKWRRG